MFDQDGANMLFKKGDAIGRGFLRGRAGNDAETASHGDSKHRNGPRRPEPVSDDRVHSGGKLKAKVWEDTYLYPIVLGHGDGLGCSMKVGRCVDWTFISISTGDGFYTNASRFPKAFLRMR